MSRIMYIFKLKVYAGTDDRHGLGQRKSTRGLREKLLHCLSAWSTTEWEELQTESISRGIYRKIVTKECNTFFLISRYPIWIFSLLQLYLCITFFFSFSKTKKFLIKEGAVMEERQGWERPGWYLNPGMEGTARVLPYDYYGSYGTSKNENDKYAEILSQDHTFNFPVHDKNVSSIF